MKREAREKLVEKNIDWKQVYTDKTLFLKEQFEAVIGPGSYFRFEGDDYGSGNRYYCIIGPSKVHKPRAKFFAGVRKLPATYSAGGKEFDSMDSAARYARETWGVDTPRELTPYTSASLHGISGKIDEWKKKREENESKEVSKDDKEKKDKEKKDSKKDKKKKDGDKKSSTNLGDTMQRFNLAEHLDIKEAMAKESMASWQTYREPYTWWNLDDLQSENDLPPDWVETTQHHNNLHQLKAQADAMYIAKAKKIMDIYHVPEDKIRDLFELYVGYHPQYGGYVTSVGPYVGKVQDRRYTFGYFSQRMLSSDTKEIGKTIKKNMTTFGKKFPGIEFDPSDFQLKVKSGDGEDDFDVYSDLSPGSDERTRLESSPVFMGEGTETGLNAKGLHKVMLNLGSNGGWSGLYREAVQEIAMTRQIPPDQISEALNNDLSLVQDASDLLRSKYLQLRGTPQAEIISIPPPNSMKISQRPAAAYYPTELRVNKEQYTRMELRKEVTDLMAQGHHNPRAILEQINLHPKRMNKPMDLDEVEMQVDAINNLRVSEDEHGNPIEKSYEELAAETTEMMGMAQHTKSKTGGPSQFVFVRGFNDFETTKDAMGLHWAKTKRDPVTHAKTGKVTIPSSFEKRKHRVNRNVEDLRAFSQGLDPDEGRELEEWIDPEAVEEVIEGIEGPVEELVDEQTPAGEEFVIEELVDEQTPANQPAGLPGLPPTPPTVTPNAAPGLPGLPPPRNEEEERERERERERVNATNVNHRMLVGNTLKNLIRIAAELDQDGKGSAAEEIHKIIRKYKGELE